MRARGILLLFERMTVSICSRDFYVYRLLIRHSSFHTFKEIDVVVSLIYS